MVQQIYYDPTSGFLYSLDANQNAEVIKTDPCVFLPENVFVDKQGYIHVKNLQGRDQILKDENGFDISIKGPTGPPGPQGTPVDIKKIDSNNGITTVTFTNGEKMTVNDGKDGIDGQNGTSVRLIPNLQSFPAQYQIGDSCILIQNDVDSAYGPVEEGTVYEFNGNAWAHKFSIKGPKGDSGKDGITPLLKIENNYWYISYDNGATWTQVGKAIDELALAAKQDKTDNALILSNGNVVNAINETFYNIWNPVHYDQFKSSSESKIVLTEKGELKLTWKYGQNPESEERSIVVKTDTTRPSTVHFADRNYVRQFQSEEEILQLNTANKTIVGAINELALLHNLTGTISHTCSGDTRIGFHKIDKTLSTDIEYILQGSVNNSKGESTNLACVIAIPTDVVYNNPAQWGSLSQIEYQNDIKVIDFGNTFTLNKEHVLYLVFMSHRDISDRLGHFDEPGAWVYSDELYADTTISVNNLNIIPSSESQAKQLENQNEIISQLSLQVQQLQTQLLELKNKISWLDQLDQEGLVKAWGKETNS